MLELDRSQWIGLGVIALGLSVLLWVLVAVLRRQVEEGSSDSASAYTRGLTAMIEGNRKEALRNLKEAVHYNSENVDAYLRMGDLLRESGQPRKALSVHQDLTVRSRLSEADRARVLESLSFDHLALEQYEEAGQCADRLRRLDKRHTGALLTLQRVAEAQGDWKRAIDAVDERLRVTGSRDGLPSERLAREQALYRCTVARKQMAAGEKDLARKNLEEAAQLDGGCHQAHMLLGDLARDRGDLEKAMKHWRTMAMGEPREAWRVFDRMERAAFDLGRYGDMPEFYRELLHRSPREASVGTLLALAEMHRRKGEFSEAENFLSDALEIEPDNLRAHRHRIKLSLDQRNVEEAQRRLDGLLSALDAEDPTAGDS